MRLLTLFWRAARLRCPRCGEGALFEGWFRMPPRCAHCGLTFDREPGYFLGSIYFNYGATAGLVTTTYFAGFFFTTIPNEWLLAGLAVVCVVFPLWFFRYARALWLGFDELMDRRETPPINEQR